MKQKGIPGLLTRGIGAFAGADITAAATFQFPHRVEDWVGPTVATFIDLYRDVILPAAEAAGGQFIKDEKHQPGYVLSNGVDWLESLPLIMGYCSRLMLNKKDCRLTLEKETYLKDYRSRMCGFEIRKVIKLIRLAV